jgi:hypothetical protein
MTSTTSGNIWAYGIIVALLIFMSGTVYFVLSTASTNVDLVYDDYYERTIGYDAHMERRDRGQQAEYKIKSDVMALLQGQEQANLGELLSKAASLTGDN